MRRRKRDRELDEASKHVGGISSKGMGADVDKESVAPGRVGWEWRRMVKTSGKRCRFIFLTFFLDARFSNLPLLASNPPLHLSRY